MYTMSVTKNKFAHPPYLPEYDRDDALRLEKVLKIISETCCRHKIPEGAVRDMADLLNRPSQIRACDLYVLRPLVDAINLVSEELEALGKEEKAFLDATLDKAYEFIDGIDDWGFDQKIPEEYRDDMSTNEIIDTVRGIRKKLGLRGKSEWEEENLNNG